MGFFNSYVSLPDENLPTWGAEPSPTSPQQMSVFQQENIFQGLFPMALSNPPSTSSTEPHNDNIHFPVGDQPWILRSISARPTRFTQAERSCQVVLKRYQMYDSTVLVWVGWVGGLVILVACCGWLQNVMTHHMAAEAPASQGRRSSLFWGHGPWVQFTTWKGYNGMMSGFR